MRHRHRESRRQQLPPPPTATAPVVDSTGDPTSPLRWTCKSRAKLAAALTEQGWRVSSTTVGRLLHRLGYRLQSPRKRQEGATHPDRNAQFEHINRTADEHLSAGEPVISVDTKKKELVGNFKNGGREWQPKGTPPAVLVHDFPTDAEGKAIPYGIYDMARNEAWVSVGWDHDTPAFAVASIRHWWHQMGCGAYPHASPHFAWHQITPKTSRNARCSISMLPNVSINGRIRSSGQLGRWWYSINPCRNNECVRRFTVFAFNHRSYPIRSPAAPSNDSTAIANALINSRRSRRSGRETCIDDK